MSQAESNRMSQRETLARVHARVRARITSTRPPEAP
jgi:hypothetical protein